MDEALANRAREISAPHLAALESPDANMDDVVFITEERNGDRSVARISCIEAVQIAKKVLRLGHEIATTFRRNPGAGRRWALAVIQSRPTIFTIAVSNAATARRAS